MPDEKPRRLLGVPVEVALLGAVSFLTDVSSEMLFAVLPLFLTGVLGASVLLLGAMEGLADFAASSLDMASGWLSDRTGRRKPIALFGYALSSAAKAVLALASTAGHVVAFRIVERLGKSIRGAPRDALLASIAPEGRRGAAFGLHKALDKAGAILGPLVAWALLGRLGETTGAFRTLFLAALVPAVLAVAVLGAFVKERPAESRPRLGFREALRGLPSPCRRYLAVAALFSLGYCSFAFPLLAANAVGFTARDGALLYGLLNLAATLASVPAGRLGDRIGRRTLLAASYGLYAVVTAGFAFAQSKVAVVLLFAVYGVFFAIDEGQTKAFVVDLAPKDSRATALGVYGFVTGLAYLPASLLAGALWKLGGRGPAFAVASGLALVALALFLASKDLRGARDAPPEPSVR